MVVGITVAEAHKELWLLVVLISMLVCLVLVVSNVAQVSGAKVDVTCESFLGK